MRGERKCELRHVHVRGYQGLHFYRIYYVRAVHLGGTAFDESNMMA